MSSSRNKLQCRHHQCSIDAEGSHWSSPATACVNQPLPLTKYAGKTENPDSVQSHLIKKNRNQKISFCDAVQIFAFRKFFSCWPRKIIETQLASAANEFDQQVCFGNASNGKKFWRVENRSKIGMRLEGNRELRFESL